MYFIFKNMPIPIFKTKKLAAIKILEYIIIKIIISSSIKIWEYINIIIIIIISSSSSSSSSTISRSGVAHYCYYHNFLHGLIYLYPHMCTFFSRYLLLAL
jgi:hypothetical protein